MDLSLYETRVIGCLIEKEITTPDQYPLTLNSLVSACNQKSNREPVLELDEATVQQTVDELVKKHLVSSKSGFGSRVTKYQHRFCNTEFGTLHFSPKELAIICVLFLRGPQTPGELRTRTERLCTFRDVQEVESTLNALTVREDGPYVVKLARAPGKREARYAHLFSGEVAAEAEPAEGGREAASPGSDRERLEWLEQRVEQLGRELAELRRELGIPDAED